MPNFIYVLDSNCSRTGSQNHKMNQQPLINTKQEVLKFSYPMVWEYLSSLQSLPTMGRRVLVHQKSILTRSHIILEKFCHIQWFILAVDIAALNVQGNSKLPNTSWYLGGLVAQHKGFESAKSYFCSFPLGWMSIWRHLGLVITRQHSM